MKNLFNHTKFKIILVFLFLILGTVLVLFDYKSEYQGTINNQKIPSITPYLLKDIYKNTCKNESYKDNDLLGTWKFETNDIIPLSLSIPYNWKLDANGIVSLSYLIEGNLTDFNEVGKWSYDSIDKKIKFSFIKANLYPKLTKPLSSSTIPLVVQSSFDGKCLLFFYLGDYKYGKIPTN